MKHILKTRIKDTLHMLPVVIPILYRASMYRSYDDKRSSYKRGSCVNKTNILYKFTEQRDNTSVINVERIALNCAFKEIGNIA